MFDLSFKGGIRQMAYILALDQGTTSSRAILFDHAGAIAAVAQKEFQQFYPQQGWVEHDPTEILTSQLSCAVEALGKAGARPRDVAAIGMTNQRETVIVWERASGKPIYPAIVWQDRRTAAQCKALVESGAEDEITSKTGLVIDPYFSGTKIQWILDNVEGARARAERGELAFGTVDSWLIWNLTSGNHHVTDFTNASRTLLFNIVKGEWDADLLRIFGVPAQMLPEVGWSSERVGEVTTTLGLGGAAIAGIAGDQQAALFGQACFEPGATKCTYGTGSFVLVNTGSVVVRSAAGLLSTVAWLEPSGELTYALEGSVFVTGAAIQWLRDGLGLLDNAGQSEALARSVPDSGGVVFVPALTGLGAPDWDPDARGAMFGLTRGTTRAHLVRAALEAIAFEVRDVVDVMTAEAAARGAADGAAWYPAAGYQALRADGGASANDLLLQLQADQIQRPVERPVVAETTALGAAFLAGLATGVWSSQAELAATWHLDRRFAPAAPDDAAHARWRSAVEQTKGWAG